MAYFEDRSGLYSSYERRDFQLDCEQLQDGGHHPDEIVRVFAKAYPMIWQNPDLRETCSEMVNLAFEEGQPNNWETYRKCAVELLQSEGIPIPGSEAGGDSDYENFARESLRELQENRIR